MKDLKGGLKEAQEKMKQLAEQELMHRNGAEQTRIEMLQLKGRIELLQELIKDQKKPKGGKNGGNT